MKKVAMLTAKIIGTGNGREGASKGGNFTREVKGRALARGAL
jgi:hypothetical protein